VQVADPQSVLDEVVGEVLGHALRERRDQHALVLLDARRDLVHEVVDLALGGPHLDLGVDQPGRPDELLGDVDAVGKLELARRRTHEDDLRHLGEELVDAERPIVERARQAEPVVDEGGLARTVALVHAGDLGQRHVRLVDEAQPVVGEVVEQAVGGRPRLLAEQDARVVLDAVAEAHLAQHLHVVERALAKSMGLENLAVLLEPGAALVELALDLDEGTLDRRPAGDEVRRRVDGDVARPLEHLAADRVEADDLLDLVAPEEHPHGRVFVGGPDLDGVAADAELAAPGLEVVARVLVGDELAQDVVAVDGLADLQEDDALEVLLRRAETVDAAHRGDDDDVAA